MKRSIILILLLWTAVLVKLPAQVKYSNEFLSIGAGARLMGMGGAGTALVDDVTAGYWNPSRLNQIDGRMDFGLMHSEYFAGLAKYDYAGAAFRVDPESVIGISFVRFGVDDIPNTLELIDEEGNVRYDRIQNFSAADMGLIFSYSRLSPVPGLVLGGNAKLIYRHTGDFASAWGFGLDASASYALGKWHFAAVARDVSGTFNVWAFKEDKLRDAFELTGNEMPENSLEVTVPRLILAVARDFKIGEHFRLAPALDLHLTFDGRRHVFLPIGPVGIDPYVGGEFRYRNWLVARVGVGNFQWVPGFNGKNDLNLQPTIGLGIQYRNFFLDYALTDVGDLSLGQYSNLISVRYLLN
ncbi:MAG: hypothetical protein PHN30_01655 [Bacteroidales bacterium]|jgi:hypothetical protein|nr:hypothetical protein [Bacteroidales bacterium]MDD2812098.1 hypothetical protein [Bacteroidales bacterium]MDD3384399.1 hypothetical protein [Bacteroidales bacterium]MDD3870670.1 hypothetical protein [Bacteroidales bacterium]MDD4812934.1 hypothetical protein [Bacteroidales bacterium]